MNVQPSPDIEYEVRMRYRAMRAAVPDGTSITVLHIGAERTGVATGRGAEPDATLALGIGSQKTSRDHFKHAPPTAVELENAIAAVEDEVARARAMIASGSVLYTTDAAVGEIALMAGVSDGAESTLALDGVEQTFQRLAAVTLGRPALREGLPTSAAFAATLLILREFMHHMRFLSITIKK